MRCRPSRLWLAERSATLQSLENRARRGIIGSDSQRDLNLGDCFLVAIQFRQRDRQVRVIFRVIGRNGDRGFKLVEG